MSTSQDETLEQRLNRLIDIMGQVKRAGMDGEMLAQRIEGDLHRLMNTAWLNCSDLIHRHERQQEGAMPVAAQAAMEYAMSADHGQAFLRHWLESDFDTIRSKWPDAPEMIFVSRDLIL